jgi:hypothetical protein
VILDGCPGPISAKPGHAGLCVEAIQISNRENSGHSGRR